jgi:hypothetical protein
VHERDLELVTEVVGLNAHRVFEGGEHEHFVLYLFLLRFPNWRSLKHIKMMRNISNS